MRDGKSAEVTYNCDTALGGGGGGGVADHTNQDHHLLYWLHVFVSFYPTGSVHSRLNRRD